MKKWSILLIVLAAVTVYADQSDARGFAARGPRGGGIAARGYGGHGAFVARGPRGNVVAGRTYGGHRGYYGHPIARGAAWGAAAVGAAAAAGAYGYQHCGYYPYPPCY
jgi:hypothetical protein